MRYRLLLAFPVAPAVALLAGEIIIPDGDLRRIFYRVLALLGCATAMMVFQRGDYLRRAWALYALDSVLLGIRDMLGGVLSPFFKVPTDNFLQAALVTAANTCGVMAVWMFASALRVAGLESPDSKGRRIFALACVTAIALSLAGPSLVLNLRALGTEPGASIVRLVSNAADIISLCLLGPVVLTAVALRGGLLVWPWALLSATLLTWLLYDAIGAEASLFLSAGTVNTIIDYLRSVAILLTFASGLAQWLGLETRGATNHLPVVTHGGSTPQRDAG